MKIGIVGNYGNDNNGDEAILQGVIHQLESQLHIERHDMTVFSNQPEQTRERYGVEAQSLYIKKGNKYKTFLATAKHHLRVVKQFDLLIIGGGGILMDLYGTEAILYGMYGWLGKLTGTPVVVYGVGAGPILSKKGATMIRSLVNLSEFTSVRDPESKKLLESIGVKKDIHIIGDPAFTIQPPASYNHRNQPLKIGVTAVPYYNSTYWPTEDLEKYNHYVQGMAANLDTIVEKYEDVEIHFFATKFPQDMWVTQDIQKEMKHGDRATVKEEALQPHEIVAFTNEQDLVLGTRLHSLILSIVTETPILAVAYHHKVQHFMDMIERSDDVVGIEDLHGQPDFFLKRYDEMRTNWSETTTTYKAVAEKMKGRASKGTTLIREAMQKGK